MPFYELTVLRERCLGSTENNSKDATLQRFGNQADNQIYNELYRAATKYGKKQALPSIDILNGKIGGVDAPQDIKDAATDRAAALYFQWLKAVDVAKMYFESSKVAVLGFVDRLKVDEIIYSDNV